MASSAGAPPPEITRQDRLTCAVVALLALALPLLGAWGVWEWWRGLR